MAKLLYGNSYCVGTMVVHVIILYFILLSVIPNDITHTIVMINFIMLSGVILSVTAPSQVVEFNLSCLASLLGRDS